MSITVPVSGLKVPGSAAKAFSRKSNRIEPTNADLGFVEAAFNAITDQDAGTHLFTAQVLNASVFTLQGYSFSDFRRTSGFSKLTGGTEGATNRTFTSNSMLVGDAGDVSVTIAVDFTGPTSGTISATIPGVIEAPPGGIIFITSMGIRNWHAGSATAADSIVQFGLPFALDEQLDPDGVVLTMMRDSDSQEIPTQIDLRSTRRGDGTLAYAVITAKMPAVAAMTTEACTLTFNSGVYTGGAAVADDDDLEALDLKIEATGGDITTLATASLNDYVYRRQIKSGAVVCAWEGWSRFKEGGSPAGQWAVRWRAELSDATTIAALHLTVFCCDWTSTPFGSSARGRSGRFTVKSGLSTLNDDFASADVFVSGNTGFKVYASDSRLPAAGGVTLRPVHHRGYLEQTAAILPHRWGSVDNDGVTTTLGSFSDAYAPGGLGGFRTAWAGTSVDATLGPYAGVSYNMLYDLADDARWKRGYDAGLKMLGASLHNFDPATGFHKPRFGTYDGLAAAQSGRAQATAATYNSSNAARMTTESGHVCDTAYVPALLTGEPYFTDALTWAMFVMSNYDQAYFRVQCSGRPVRYYPLVRPDNMARYTVLSLRQLAHFSFVCDDERPDKAYAAACLGETEEFATDLFIDKLQWVKVSGTPADAPPAARWAAFDGTGSGGPYALKIWTSNENGEFGNASRDSAWSCDYGLYPFWWLYRRDGEAWIKTLFEEWMSHYYIGRALGDGACVAYSAQYAALTQPNTWNNGAGNEYAFVQTWGDYWLTVYSGGTFVQRNDGVCPSTASVGQYEGIYQSGMALMAKTDIGGAHDATFQDVVNALGVCFRGGSGNAISYQPRWEIAL